MSFEINAVMASLKKSLPNANVRLPVITPEMRREGLDRLRSINQLKSKTVPLGSGALTSLRR